MSSVPEERDPGPTESPGIPAPEVSIEAESDDTQSESFSDYGSAASSTASADSLIFDYQYENGRRYHAFHRGQYLLPNDEVEQDRLDMTHHVFRLSLGGELCMTKLESPKRILDVGTGTGIWAMEMGDVFPDCEIIGTDLSPVQPTWVPPNVHFQIDNAREEWTFAPDYFDFIHVRTMAGSILDWPAFLRQCYTHLKPGGKLEISEGRANFWFLDDGSVPTESYTYKWLMEWRQLSAKMQFDVFPQLSAIFNELPFEAVKTVENVCPLGAWPRNKKLKEVGRFFQLQFLDSALEAYTLALFTRVGGWQELEVKAMLARVRSEMQANKMHLYTFCSFLTAQKPLSAPNV